MNTVLKQNNMLWATSVADRKSLDAKLDAAHGQIERKFLDGGAVLVSISDILKRLVGSLDALTGALDDETSSATIGKIQATAGELASLPADEEKRRLGFDGLAAACKAMRGNVDDMRDTMRYLRTFAVTVKITGAGLAEFDGFADEIRERIQSGSDEVNRFASELEAMNRQLSNAISFSGSISQNYGNIVPKIVGDLAHNAGLINTHRDQLVSIASQVKALALGIQMKVATVLSALQIGDITRQRIEHVRTSFDYLEEFKASPEGAALGTDALARLEGVIHQLAAAQMEETVSDFRRDCRKIVETMGRFVDDTHQILKLRDGMRPADDGDHSNPIRDLEENVAAASRLVGGVRDTSIQAHNAAKSTGETASNLSRGIEIIRSIKIDIHYMALNSNLRCSKLGDEGRSVNVVSGELRFFAEKLEAPADAVLAELSKFEVSVASLLAGNADGEANDVSLPLNEALAAIRAVSETMDARIREFEADGQEVFTRVTSAIATLDFDSELGDVLDDCAQSAGALAELASGDVDDLAGGIDGLSARIYKVYTMASERAIHRQFLPAEAETARVTPAASDEDLFEDALF